MNSDLFDVIVMLAGFIGGILFSIIDNPLTGAASLIGIIMSWEIGKLLIARKHAQ